MVFAKLIHMSQLRKTQCLSLLSLCLFSSHFAFAAYHGPGSTPALTTSKGVMATETLAEQPVKLMGKITKQLDKDKYQFQDPSGELVVEIGKALFNQIEVNETTEVILIGETRREAGATEVSVELIQLVTDAPITSTKSTQNH